jgi:hypothetical protein
LLDSTARARLRNVQVGDSSPAEEVSCGADQASTATATPNRLPAAEDPRQRRKHLNLVLAFYGLGIAAAAALTLLSWSERARTPPGLPGIAGEQLPNPQPAQLVKSASPALAANAPPDQGSGGAELRPSKPEVAGSSHVGHANRDDDQAAGKDAANSANAIAYAGQPATDNALAAMPAWRDERTSRNLSRLGGTPGRFELQKQRSDFGDVIGRLARKSIAANVSFSYVFLGRLSASSTNRSVT